MQRIPTAEFQASCFVCPEPALANDRLQSAKRHESNTAVSGFVFAPVGHLERDIDGLGEAPAIVKEYVVIPGPCASNKFQYKKSTCRVSARRIAAAIYLWMRFLKNSKSVERGRQVLFV